MAQMPGEARGYQFAPQQAAGVPAAMVDNFKQIEDLPTLIAMQQRNPSIPLLAHIDEVRKRMEARQAMQSQLAMQQAQQQGPQTLNDQILAGAEQVAGTAPVRRMATGGIVALSGGGRSSVTEPVYENPDFDAEGRPRGVTEKNAIIERNRLRQQAYERARQGAPRSLMGVMESAQRAMPPEAISRLQEFPPVGPRGGETAEDRAKVAARLAATDTAYPEPVAVREGRRAAPAAAPEAAPRERRTPPKSPLRNVAKDLRRQRRLPPRLTPSRKH